MSRGKLWVIESRPADGSKPWAAMCGVPNAHNGRLPVASWRLKEANRKTQYRLALYQRARVAK